VYAAYKAASERKGQPTVILTKTVKGVSDRVGRGWMVPGGLFMAKYAPGWRSYTVSPRKRRI
jgi:hypothetical protein